MSQEERGGAGGKEAALRERQGGREDRRRDMSTARGPCKQTTIPFRVKTADGEQNCRRLLLAGQWPPPQVEAYLSEEGLFVGHLVLQLVVQVVDRGGLPLGGQVAFLQRGDPLLHVFLLGHGLIKHTAVSNQPHCVWRYLTEPSPSSSPSPPLPSSPLSGLAAAVCSCLQT